MSNIDVIKKVLEGNIKISMEKIYIELTNRCNLQCVHCYNNSNNGINIDLPFDLVKGMIEFAKSCGLDSVALSGGEALLYPRINEVMKLCEDLDLSVQLLTNGTYIKDEYIDIILKYKPDIQVSLEGPDAASNDYIRGKGSFKKAIGFIKQLKKQMYPKSIFVNTVLTESNSSNYSEMVNLCHELGVDNLTYSIVTFAGRAKTNNIQLKQDKFLDIVKRINSALKSDPKNNCQGVGMNHHCSLIDVRNDLIYLQPKVAYNGDVFPCQMHNANEYVIGNIKKSNLYDVLNSEITHNFLILMLIRRSFMRECAECAFSSMCDRGCMAKAVNDFANPLANDGCCYFYKELLLEQIKNVRRS